ncbi:MAG: hypothetical protein WBM71_08085, partial [Sedimenticolaceae bacterium]
AGVMPGPGVTARSVGFSLAIPANPSPEITFVQAGGGERPVKDQGESAEFKAAQQPACQRQRSRGSECSKAP